MDSTTPRYNLPYLASSQAQKHVTHNEALRMLDLAVDACAFSWDAASPPADPAEGECHLVAAGATGAFAGHDGELAGHVDGAWAFAAPFPGMRVWDSAGSRLMVFHDGAWRDLAVLGLGATLGALADGASGRIGVNAAADATNRLSVKADAALFSHDDATPGSGDTRLVVNKAAVANTASVLFQTGYSGRAEFGLTGSDAFALKVSPDGATWYPSVSIPPATGRLTLKASLDGDGRAIDNVSSLVVGGTAALQPTTLYGNAMVKNGQMLIRSDNWSGVDMAVASASAYPTLSMRRRRGTIAASAAAKTGDILGEVSCYGHDGGADASVLYLTGIAATDFNVARSAAWRLAVTNAGAFLEVQRWTAQGNVGIGTATPTTKLHVDGPVRVKSYAVADLPGASAGAGAIVFVSDEAGGAVLAFSDGASWRRVTDRAVVS